MTLICFQKIVIIKPVHTTKKCCFLQYSSPLFFIITITITMDLLLIANFHFTLSWAASRWIFNSLKSPRPNSFAVYLSPYVLRYSPYFFTQLFFPILSTCPNHLSLSLCMQFLTNTNHGQSLNSPDDFLFFSVTLHTSHTITMSFLSTFAESSSFTADIYIN